MITLTKEVGVFVYLEPIDMRKQINGLVALIVDDLHMSPQANQVYVFIGKDKRKLKLLYWHGNGFVMLYKRLEQERFIWPRMLTDNGFSITTNQLQWLLAGLDFHRMQQFPQLNYSHYY